MKNDAVRIYDPTPNRPKHRWKKNCAGFQPYQGRLVGKCPQDMKLSEAQELIETAIADPHTQFDFDGNPKNLYNVYRGVIYRAIGGDFTNIYHGFPCKNIDDLDESTLQELRTRAMHDGHLKSFEKWVKKHA